MKELKSLDLSKTEFQANGQTYLIESKLTSERFFRMCEYEIEAGLGMTYKQVFDMCGEVMQLANQSKFADIVILVHNTMQGIAAVEQRSKPIMEYCAMFINRVDEDRREISEAVIDAKIADWEAEGIDFRSFFLLFVNMVDGLKTDYTDHLTAISQS